MNLFVLDAIISLSTSEYQRNLNAAENETVTFADKMKNAFTKISKIVTAALTGMVANGVKELVKQSVESYAQFEQLAGGVETLFKESSDTIMEYAKNAYQTAGLSANEYMETVTGFSAALIQSTGRGAQQDLEQLEASLDEQYEATKAYLQDTVNATKESWDAKIASAKEYDEFAVSELKHQKKKN